MNSPRSIVFIDSKVEDTQGLVASVAPGGEVFLLHQQQDGISQVIEILTEYSGFADIHIISEGDPGYLHLGNSQLHLDNLHCYANDLQHWAAVLYSACRQGVSPIRVYFHGYKAASGEMGKTFAERLSQLMGAKVALATTQVNNPKSQPAAEEATDSFCTIPTLILTFEASRGTIRYWIGAGEDKNWSNPLNWLGNALPSPQDEVVFDGRCNKDALLDICPRIKSLTVTADYTGTLSGWNKLIASENIFIFGGTINVDLEVGGDLRVENGTMNSYLHVKGNLTIDSGTVTWYGGKVLGDTNIKGGTVSFCSNYDSYYIFEGNFTRSGGSVEGMPIFGFYGNKCQSFTPGKDGMILRDLYNNFELIIDGEVTISGLLFNSGKLTIMSKAVLDARLTSCFSNSGTLIEKGKILRSKEALTKISADGNSVTSNTANTANTASNSSEILQNQQHEKFNSKPNSINQVSLKNLIVFNEV